MTEKELVELLVSTGTCETKKEAKERLKNMSEEMKKDLKESMKHKVKRSFFEDEDIKEFEVWYVKLKNGDFKICEFETEETPKEEMLNMLKENEDVVEVYEGMTNAGPMGLLFKKEEVEDSKCKDDKPVDIEYIDVHGEFPEWIMEFSVYFEDRDEFEIILVNCEKLRKFIESDIGEENKKYLTFAPTKDAANELKFKFIFVNDEENIEEKQTKEEFMHSFNLSENEFNELIDKLSDEAIKEYKNLFEMYYDDVEDFYMPDFEDSKKVKDMIVENEGWELDTNDAWDAWEEFVDEYGADEAGDALARALSYDELAENLVYIFREYDFPSKYLVKEEDEDEEE